MGGWLSAWQFAIFELFYQFGAAALPVLRRVAFGEHDWTQGNAVEVLVRLAAAGVDREQTVADLRREFPGSPLVLSSRWFHRPSRNPPG